MVSKILRSSLENFGYKSHAFEEISYSSLATDILSSKLRRFEMELELKLRKESLKIYYHNQQWHSTKVI